MNEQLELERIMKMTTKQRLVEVRDMILDIHLKRMIDGKMTAEQFNNAYDYLYNGKPITKQITNR